MVKLDPEFEFNVSLCCLRGNFEAAIVPHSRESEGWKFAFYLLCDGIRVQAQAYSDSTTAVFSGRFKKGTYVAVGFAKSDNCKIIRKSDSLLYYTNPIPSVDKNLKFFEPIVRGSYATLKKVGYKSRADATPIAIAPPMRFDNISDRNTDFAVHAWRFLDPIWNEFLKTSNLKLIHEILGYMNDWYSFRLTAKKNGFIWYDMATGIRAIHIALLTYIVNKLSIALDNGQLSLLAKLQNEHLFKLAEPSWIKLNNHGIWQVLGLRTLVWAMGDKDAVLIKLCEDKLKELLSYSFDSEGVHTENSPFYHQYVSKLIAYLDGDLFPESREFIKTINRNSRDISMWLTDPYGMFYQIGDTEGVGVAFNPNYSLPSVNFKGVPYVMKHYNLGYATVRTLPSVAATESSALMFYGTNKHAVHSHADKLGFILFHKGIEIFADSGKYVYEYGEWQDYFLSDKAHNVLGLKDARFGPADINYADTKIGDISVISGGFLFSGKTSYLNGLFSYQRELLYDPSHELLITDRISDEQNQVLEQRFHLGVGIEASIDGGVIWLIFKDKRIAYMDVPKNCAGVSILKGQEDTIAGWCSKKYKYRQSIATIYIEFPKETSQISTRVRFLS